LLRIANTDSIVGVARNGVLIFTSLVDTDYDAYFPKAYGKTKLSPKSI